MRLRKLAAGYSIFVGISMIGMWAMFYFTGRIPEFNTNYKIPISGYVLPKGIIEYFKDLRQRYIRGKLSSLSA